MPSTDEDTARLMYPPPLAEERGTVIPSACHEFDVVTPILIVGGGPVGMLQALMFARIHHQECTILEQEHQTTRYPKMEYTNGRSMEIYRQMGLASEFRSLATKYVPEHAISDEMNVTSLSPGGYLIQNWKRKSVAEHRADSRENNDGSKYLEPHLRAHQIHVERWLRMWIGRESKIKAFWGHSFVGLTETEDGVTSEIVRDDGTILRIKSQFVIGCDGGGSWVRKSAGLESRRTYLDMQLAFVHLKSNRLRQSLPFGSFWHTNVIQGGIVVAQDEGSTFTVHMVVPPGLNIEELSAQQVVNLACAGTLEPVEIPIDEVFCRGLWRVDVAIANKFRSDRGRVFLAGDAAHQLSPIGGHGLNSGPHRKCQRQAHQIGLADAYDLCWKLTASIRGWGGEILLQSYDIERRQIAFKNLATVQECLETIVIPLIANPTLDRNLINAKNEEGEKARAELQAQYVEKHWFHDQNGNILGYQYVNSPIVRSKDETRQRQASKDFVYKPTTFPGSRAPHVWLSNGKGSVLDLFSSAAFNLVDFSACDTCKNAFVEAAEEANIPLRVVKLDADREGNTRKVYEADLVLVRPDGHVSWRLALSSSLVSRAKALAILLEATGQ